MSWNEGIESLSNEQIAQIEYRDIQQAAQAEKTAQRRLELEKKAREINPSLMEWIDRRGEVLPFWALGEIIEEGTLSQDSKESLWE